MSAFISNGSGSTTRVRKFSPGSLIGELSAYLRDKHRTATVIADDHAVLYHLNTARISELQQGDQEIRAIIHELVATTLAERVSFMNSRLLAESAN